MTTGTDATPPQTDTPWKNELFSLVVQFIAAFIIGFTAAVFVFWIQYVLPNIRQLTAPAIESILSYSLQLSFGLTIGYRLSRRFLNEFVINTLAQKFLQKPVEFATIPGAQSYVWDIFIISASVVTFSPINPIFQDTGGSKVLPLYTIIGTRFDFLPTLFILLILAALAMFANLLIVKQKSILHLLGPFAAACALSFVNFGPNYDARILETREAWKRNDPRLMASRAHAALASAQTDAEKSRAYYWLAVAHNLQEKPEMGLDYINQSITYNPHDAASNSVKAFSLARLKKFEEALQAANQCAELDPSYAWCYAAMTKIHYDQGNIEGAISAQRTAQRLDPKSPELLETLQWLEAQ